MTTQIIAVALIAAVQATIQPERPPRDTPLRVQIMVSTFEGEKKTSSVPYTLSVTAIPGGPAKLSQLRMGTKVPLPATKPPVVDGKPVTEIPGFLSGGGAVSYQEIGTNIDCAAWLKPDDQYELQITVEDNSIPREDAARAAKTQEPPMIRTFRLSNRVILRDGQSTQFTAATNRITGETVRIDVTLNVAK
jgi:hypothetical protein